MTVMAGAIGATPIIDRGSGRPAMQFLRTLFWVVLAVVMIVFANNNWVPVSLVLWTGLELDTKLPVLVIGSFLLGFGPLWILHQTMRWRLKRRIAALEANAARLAPGSTPSATVSRQDQDGPDKALRSV